MFRRVIGEGGEYTAMHMTTVIEVTLIGIEFADQLVLVGLRNADPEMCRHTGTGEDRGH